MSRFNRAVWGIGRMLYGCAFLALPEPFRSRYGEEIRTFHEDRMMDVGSSSMDRFLIWGASLLDLAWGGFRERSRSLAGFLKRFGRAGSPRHGSAGGPSDPDGFGRISPSTPGLWLDSLSQDLRFALRGLVRTRGFTVVSVFSLALGIGVFTAVFSLFNETWMKPVPGIPSTDRVVELLTTRPGTEYEVMAYPDLMDLRGATTPLEEVVGWRERAGTVTTADGGEPVRITYVSASYFTVLGVALRQGRGFLASEDVGPGQHPVAVVSHDMWQDRMDGSPDIVGRTLTLNRTPYTVVGVAPADFVGHRTLVESTEVWLPLMQDPWVAGTDSWTEDREALWIRALGRLREGSTLEEANAALRTVFSRLEELHPESNEDRGAQAHAFGPIPARGRASTLLGVYGVAALLGIVLLIICGNVAGMVLARSVAREQEIAVRMALGSGRGRLVRLLLMEALLLSSTGGCLGLLLGVWGIDAIYALIPGFPELVFSVEGPVLAFVLVLSLGTTLAVGLVPAIRFSRPELISALKDDTGGGGRRAGRVHRYSASAQAGLALVLLITCGLFLRALDVMEERDFGFDSRGLFITRIDLFQEGYESQEAAEALFSRVKTALSGVPGIVSTSVADGIPLDLSGNFTGVSRADRAEETEGRVQVEFTRVTEDFFETIGTPILKGRGIEAGDDLLSDPVLVITESLAARLWPGEEAVGRRLRSGTTRDGPREYTVVGVVPDVASSRSTENWPNVFLALRQTYQPRVMIAIKATSDLSSLARPIQTAILSADPALSFPVLVSSESLVERSTLSQRMSAGTAGGLGLLALLLAAIGVYGVVAFAVTSRTREIGLRMAMGATRGEVLRGVLKDAVRLALPGLVVGSLLAVGLAAGLRSELFGLNPLDPLSFGTAAGLLFLVVLAASLDPARRASGIDPMEALRGE